MPQAASTRNDCRAWHTEFGTIDPVHDFIALRERFVNQARLCVHGTLRGVAIWRR